MKYRIAVFYFEGEYNEKILLVLFTITLGLTLTACKTEVKIDTFTVTFGTNGGSEIRAIVVNDGRSVGKPSDPTKDGYTFGTWTLDGQTYDFSTPVKKDITLKATWNLVVVEKETFTVTFNSVGGSAVAPINVLEGDRINMPPYPVKNGFKFIEWQLNNVKYNFNAPVTSNITLVAVWEQLPPPIQIFNVTFEVMGVGNDIGVIEGDKVLAPANPTVEGYKFIEWRLNGVRFDFNTPITKDIKLVAYFEELQQYTVTFDVNGTKTTAKVFEGNKVSQPENPKVEGYDFVEWRLNGVKFNFNTIITSDITIEAHLNKHPEIYTVTFNSNGGTSISSIKVTEGNKVAKPLDPVKTNYEFVEWQLDGKTYNFNSNVTSNITLTAIYILPIDAALDSYNNFTSYTITQEADYSDMYDSFGKGDLFGRITMELEGNVFKQTMRYYTCYELEYNGDFKKEDGEYVYNIVDGKKVFTEHLMFELYAIKHNDNLYERFEYRYNTDGTVWHFDNYESTSFSYDEVFENDMKLTSSDFEYKTVDVGLLKGKKAYVYLIGNMYMIIDVSKGSKNFELHVFPADEPDFMFMYFILSDFNQTKVALPN